MSTREITRATAGPTGDGVRSDLQVRFEPSDEALSLVITSKVDYLFGKAITASTQRVADQLGVATGCLTVTDFGALDWAILARVECCLRRAGFEGPAVLPESAPTAMAAQRRERPRRSRLYIPGNQPKLMVSGGLYGADTLILDLEDSVPPAEKDAARILVRNALLALDWGESERAVRVNQGEDGMADIAELAPHNVHLILLPKVEDPDLVRKAGDLLRSTASDEGAPLLMPILESPLGIFRAYDIACSDPQVAALTLGLEDLSAELAAPRTSDATESFLARQTTVYAARAAGVAPIASVFSDINDEEGLAAYVQRESALGFDGIGCIHPRQIPIVHREMAPRDIEITKAVSIVRAARDAENRGLGAVAVGSKMVDPPVVKQALRTVELAIIAGRLTEDWDDNQGDEA